MHLSLKGKRLALSTPVILFSLPTYANNDIPVRSIKQTLLDKLKYAMNTKMHEKGEKPCQRATKIFPI